MMQITHAVSGAAVGKYAPNPIIAFLLGVLIHFIIDKIPHYWPESKITQRNIIIVDYIVTVLFIAILIFTKKLTQNMAWGMAGSLIVDIILVGIKPVYEAKIGKWHHERQPHVEKTLSFLSDIAVIAIGVAIIYWVK